MSLSCRLLLPAWALSCTAMSWAAPAPSFTRAPYINPRIIEELSIWESDSGDSVLPGSQNSNRYALSDPPADTRKPEAKGLHWQTVSNDAPFPTVCTNSGLEHLCYQFVGKNSKGLVALLIKSFSDDGRSVFNDVMLLEWHCDVNVEGTPRQLLFKRGQIALGDRVRVKRIKLGIDRLTVSYDDAKPRTFMLKGLTPGRETACKAAR